MTHEPRLRLFAGIACDAVPALLTLLEELADLPEARQDAGLRVVPPDNLHLTLKFLGMVPATRRAELEPVISRAAALCQPFDMPLRGFGCFSRSLWAGAEAGESLRALQLSLDSEFALLGFPRETLKFLPHITVARFGRHVRLPLSELTATYSDRHWGSPRINAIHLYQSTTHPAGAAYRKIFTARLADKQVQPHA